MRLIHYLYATNFITGATVMVVEILGTKLMAPRFGSSLYVWTALITVTLVCLALGYRTGGYIADRRPHASTLYALIFTAGVLLLGVLLLREPIVKFGAAYSISWGALIAAAILFGPPLFLLGTVAPFSVKLCAAHLDGLGNVVGRLYATSTFGSFVGTVAAGVFLIPNFATTTVLVFCAGTLTLLPAVYFACFRRSLAPAAGAALVVLIAGIVAFNAAKLPRGTTAEGSAWEKVYSANSFYGNISVVDFPDRNYRYLLNDGLTQGSYHMSDRVPLADFPYALSDLVLGHVAHMRRVLVLGLGAGFVPRLLARHMTPAVGSERFAPSDFVAIEINARMVDVAVRFFDFPPDDFTVVVEDARTWVSKYAVTPATPAFDAIIFDAFLGDNVPGHLLSLEMFVELRRILAPEGALAINMFGSIRGRRSQLLAAVYRTMTRGRDGTGPFPHVQVFSKEATGSPHNIYMLAHSGPAGRRPNGIRRVAPPRWMVAELNSALQDQTAEVTGIDAAPLLRDDYNVAEYLDLAVKEDIRRGIRDSYGDILAQ